MGKINMSVFSLVSTAGGGGRLLELIAGWVGCTAVPAGRCKKWEWGKHGRGSLRIPMLGSSTRQCMQKPGLGMGQARPGQAAASAGENCNEGVSG